ncbi:hypothetical protein JYU34_015022 [Plutella xylostella]|uniref:Uncharacterized protein n=1 Tax=Plutella xylostella TaxID=51655 RepID=A0ABQ7Q628_PLUXY|nr:hypothetical protein JYU34_015022 [Plutella xylostella]
MGNSCSSGQAHKDKDNVSQQSEESHCCARRSPSYRVAKPPVEEAAPERSQPLLEPTAPAKDKKPLRGPRTVASSVSDSISLSSPVATCASPKELEGPPAPVPVASLPEEHRAALLGRLPAQRARRRQAMLIYVCAADSQDCCSEKGALQCGAAARLRVRARRRGWRVHVADLHWRSPLEQQRDHRFPQLCTAELAQTEADCSKVQATRWPGAAGACKWLTCTGGPLWSSSGTIDSRSFALLSWLVAWCGWRVHVADLHLRSPLEQQRDHRFPQLCTAELARHSELDAVVPVLFLNSGSIRARRSSTSSVPQLGSGYAAAAAHAGVRRLPGGAGGGY